VKAPVTPEESVEFIKGISDSFLPQMDPDQDWAPILFVCQENGDPVAFGLSGRLLDDKERFCRLLPNLVHSQVKSQVTLITLVISSWMVIMEEGEQPADLSCPPSEHPDRIEALQIISVAPDDMKVAVGRIIREEGHHPELEWEENSFDTMEGRFAEALRRTLD